MKDEKRPSVYPQEMPSGENKDYRHGVIENVVKSEINPTAPKSPASYPDTDSVNTEFARRQIDSDLKS